MISLVLLGIVSRRDHARDHAAAAVLPGRQSDHDAARPAAPGDVGAARSTCAACRPIGDDIIVATDSSIEFMMNVGTGIVCEVIDGTQVALPPPKPRERSDAHELVLDTASPTRRSYTVYIYNDSSVVGNEDDRWQKFTLSDVHAQRQQVRMPFTHRGRRRPKSGRSSSCRARSLTISSTGGPLSRYIDVGAPVRVMKRVRYALYQAAATANGISASRTYNTSTSTYGSLVARQRTVRPVLGSRRPRASASGTTTSTATRSRRRMDSATRAKIARVDLIARARTSSNVRAAGIQSGANQQYKDSLAVSVMLRNRN